jgi:hypothetical protein
VNTDLLADAFCEATRGVHRQAQSRVDMNRYCSEGELVLSVDKRHVKESIDPVVVLVMYIVRWKEGRKGKSDAEVSCLVGAFNLFPERLDSAPKPNVRRAV